MVCVFFVNDVEICVLMCVFILDVNDLCDDCVCDLI